MRNSRNLWTAFQLARTFRCRPSELYGIDEYPAAFYFDRAVGLFGVHLENELARVDSSKRSKQQKEMAKKMLLNRYLGPPRGGEG